MRQYNEQELLQQLENNLMQGFRSDFAVRAAWAFQLRHFTLSETEEILNQLPEMPKYWKRAILDAYEQLAAGTIDPSEHEYWDSEELQAMMMHKKFNN